VIVALLVLSAIVAASAAGAALWFGWGIWASILIYCLGGSLTLLLLAALVGRYLPSDAPEDEDA
jgi:hypothetical protein